MDIKAAVTVATLLAGSSVHANGGLSIDSVDQHMNSEVWVATQSVQPEITVQGPLEAFEDYRVNGAELVDTNKLRQDYDSQS